MSAASAPLFIQACDLPARLDFIVLRCGFADKEDIGLLKGVVGGFAGGEAALRRFAETGELKLRKPGEPVRRQFSPLTLAFLIIFGAAGGGAALTYFVDLGEDGVKELVQASLGP